MPLNGKGACAYSYAWIELKSAPSMTVSHRPFSTPSRSPTPSRPHSPVFSPPRWLWISAWCAQVTVVPAGQQDQRVEQRQFEGVDDLQPLGRPLRGDRGGTLGGALDLAVDEAHRGREQREVEERPEPADEEHHFRRDEQDHAVAEMELDDGRVVAGMRFA